MKTSIFYLTIWCICTCMWSCQNASSTTKNDIISTDTSLVVQVNPTIDLSLNDVPSKPAVDSLITIKGRYFGAGLSEDLKKETGGTEFQFITTTGDIYFVKYVPNELDISTCCFDCLELKAKIIPMPPAEKYQLKFIEVKQSSIIGTACGHIINKDKKPVPLISAQQLEAMNKAEKAKGNQPFIVVSAELHRAFRPASDIEYDFELKNWSKSLESPVFKAEPENQTVFFYSPYQDFRWNTEARNKKRINIVGRLRRGYSEHFVFKAEGLFVGGLVKNTTFDGNVTLKNSKKYQVRYVDYLGNLDDFHAIKSAKDELAKNICGTNSYHSKDEKRGVLCATSIDHDFVEKLPFATRKKPHELTLHYQNGKSETFTNEIDTDRGDNYFITNYSRQLNHIFIQYSGYENDAVMHLINLQNGERLPLKGYAYVKEDMTEIIEYAKSDWGNWDDPFVAFWKYYDGEYHREWSHDLEGEELPNSYKWDENGDLYATIAGHAPVQVEMYYPVKKYMTLDFTTRHIPVYNWFPKEISLPDFAENMYRNLIDTEHFPEHFFLLIGADETGLWTLQGANCSSATTLQECADIRLVYSRYKGKEDFYKLENTNASGDRDIAATIAQELRRLEKEKVLKSVKLSACEAQTYENVFEVASEKYNAGRSFVITSEERVKGQVGCWHSARWRSKN